MAPRRRTPSPRRRRRSRSRSPRRRSRSRSPRRWRGSPPKVKHPPPCTAPPWTQAVRRFLGQSPKGEPVYRDYCREPYGGRGKPVVGCVDMTVEQLRTAIKKYPRQADAYLQANHGGHALSSLRKAALCTMYLAVVPSARERARAAPPRRAEPAPTIVQRVRAVFRPAPAAIPPRRTVARAAIPPRPRPPRAAAPKRREEAPRAQPPPIVRKVRAPAPARPVARAPIPAPAPVRPEAPFVPVGFKWPGRMGDPKDRSAAIVREGAYCVPPVLSKLYTMTSVLASFVDDSWVSLKVCERSRGGKCFALLIVEAFRSRTPDKIFQANLAASRTNVGAKVQTIGRSECSGNAYFYMLSDLIEGISLWEAFPYTKKDIVGALDLYDKLSKRTPYRVPVRPSNVIVTSSRVYLAGAAILNAKEVRQSVASRALVERLLGYLLEPGMCHQDVAGCSSPYDKASPNAQAASNRLVLNAANDWLRRRSVQPFAESNFPGVKFPGSRPAAVAPLSLTYPTKMTAETIQGILCTSNALTKEYRVTKILGYGFQGAVVRACRAGSKTECNFAIKTVLARGRQSAVGKKTVEEYFHPDKQAAAVGVGPKVYSTGEVTCDGEKYYFMVGQLLEGTTLWYAFPYKKAVIEEALSQYYEMRSETDYTQDDLKPENIMVSPRGEVTIIDYGVAKPVPKVPDHPAFDKDMRNAASVLLLLLLYPGACHMTTPECDVPYDSATPEEQAKSNAAVWRAVNGWLHNFDLKVWTVKDIEWRAPRTPTFVGPLKFPKGFQPDRVQ